MVLSIDTLLLATGFVGLVVAGTMLSLRSRHGDAPGYVAWLGGVGLHGIGLLVLGATDVWLPHGFVAPGNLAVAVAALFYVRAIGRLRGGATPMRALVALTLAVAIATVVFTFVTPSTAGRLGALGLQYLAAQSVLIVLLARGLRTEPGRAYRVLFALVVVATLAMLGRSVWFATNPAAQVGDAVGFLTIAVNLAFFATAGLAYLGVLEDRQRRALTAAYAALERASHHDALTGLAHRGTFDAALDRELERVARYPQPLSLLLVDLDRFKGVNDAHGHDVGDAVLRATADALRGVGRRGDVVARVGGEEFAVVLPATAGTQALALAERLRSAVAATRVAGGEGVVAVTASIGVAERRDGDDRDALYHRADAALYAAKRAGRDRVVVAGASVAGASVAEASVAEASVADASGGIGEPAPAAD